MFVPETRTLATVPAVVGGSAPARAGSTTAWPNDSRGWPRCRSGVLALAVEARPARCAMDDAPESARLAVIDYTRPSTQQRLWVFDLERETLLYTNTSPTAAAVARISPPHSQTATRSHQTSLGLFTTDDTYVGGNGYSLRMDGLEPGVNDNARARLIVMHGAPYVDPAQALRQGRLGRSFGCPALRPQVARQVIDTLKQGQLLFAYANEAAWLSGRAISAAAAATRARSSPAHGRTVAVPEQTGTPTC